MYKRQVLEDISFPFTSSVISHGTNSRLKAFSENGALLASVGQDDNHCLAVHDWEKGKLQHTGPTDMRAVRERPESNNEKYNNRSC